MENNFWKAIKSSDLEAVDKLLEIDPSLASKNYAPESPHTDGFPLYHASKYGHIDLVRALLSHGADPDASLKVENPREVGMPLMFALEAENFEMLHLLLDHGASWKAFPYCATPFVDEICNAFWKKPWNLHIADDKLSSLIRNSFAPYLGNEPSVLSPLTDSSSEILRLLDRVVAIGGRPSLFTVVRHELHDLIQDLLQYCPTKKGTALDWQSSRVFDNIVGAASWCGYPKTLKDCKDLAPELYTSLVSKESIEQAIRSHNRDGCIEEYFQLIKAELEYLKSKGDIDSTYKDEKKFTPIHWLETDFIEPKNYGFKCHRLSTQEDLEQLKNLFLDFGLKE